MPFQNWNLSWLNLNSQRKYPLADDADGVSDSGDFTLPDDFIVELDLAVHAGMDVSSGGFFIQSVSVYSTGYAVVVGYQPDVGDPVTVATALIAKHLFTRNKVYALAGVEPFDDAVGKVVIGGVDSIDLQPEGVHTFEFEHTRLDPDAIRPNIRGVSAIVVVNNGQRSQPLYGVVEVVAGTNMQIVPVLVDGEDPILQFNAIQGEGTVTDCECVSNTTSPPIREINGVRPTADGNFTLVGDDCAQVQPITNGVKLVDVCSKPCCGCPELETITRDLERLRGEAASVRDFNTQLRSSVNTMDLTVLGSRLGDRGCFE